MGSAWHKKENENKKEWVIYAVAGIVLMLIAAGVAVGVVVAKKNSGDGAPSPDLDATVDVNSAPPVLSPPPRPPAPSPPPLPVAKAPSPARAPVAAPVPAPAAAATPVPAPTTLPPVVVASPSPSPAAATPSSPDSPAAPTAPSTYDPTFVAPNLLAGAPPAPGFVPPLVEAGKEGTCDLLDGKEYKCNDGMPDEPGVDVSMLQLMADATMMELCGFTDMTKIANSLVKWAYKGQCGINVFSTVRACIGKPGTAAEGFWRARIMLWPSQITDTCLPLCVKMRGSGDEVRDYGRHASCNAEN